MAEIDISKTELVWPGKYNEDGNRKEAPRVSLPFQIIETINESRATRDAEKSKQLTLFDIWKGDTGNTFESGWKNKLIWGDNLLVMGSLMEKYAGKIDLIYIDPPFATGADFSFQTEIGDSDLELNKDQSILEEKAYRDTWGNGLVSYLQMMYERISLMKDLLSDRGSIYVHCDWHVGDYLKVILDEIFDVQQFRNEIIWRRHYSHNDGNRYGCVHDTILWYSKTKNYTWNRIFLPYSEEYMQKNYPNIDEKTGKRFRSVSMNAAGNGEPKYFGDKLLSPPPGTHWRWSQERINKAMDENVIFFTSNGVPRYKQFLDDMEGLPVQDTWIDFYGISSQSNERLGYETQKPEALIERIVKASSVKGDIVLDVFCGSGTTLAVAEKLGRRWIGCDLGRFAIHTTRKRLLEIDGCKPFEILNLGKYERKYWQISLMSGHENSMIEHSVYEYLAFILRLYGAQPLPGLMHIHGKKGRAMVHIGSVDAPVTIDEINAALSECVQLKQPELHVLGWEWEMGLAGPNNDYRKGGLMHEVAKQKGVKLLLLQIPRDVMEQQAVDQGDIQFFELAYLDVEIGNPKKLKVVVSIKDFVIPNTELIPEDVREKVSMWSDYIDYWAIDWDFRNDTFIQGWVAYRTRQNRSLPLKSDNHTYEKPGKYRILVKVIDIFGNDTSQAYDVQVV